MLELRGYQRKLLQKTLTALGPRSVRVMMQLPTGGGKTIIACHLLASDKDLISPRERRSRAQRLPSGLFLCADFSASNSIKMAVKLLERCGEDPSQFRVQLS